MAADVPDFRASLNSILATLPRDLANEINELVDDIEEWKWNEGWDAAWKGVVIG